MTLAFPHLWIPARNILSPAADWLAATSSALRTRPASSAQRNRCGDAAMEMQDPSCCGFCSPDCGHDVQAYTAAFSGVTVVTEPNVSTNNGGCCPSNIFALNAPGTYCVPKSILARNSCAYRLQNESGGGTGWRNHGGLSCVKGNSCDATVYSGEAFIDLQITRTNLIWDISLRYIGSVYEPNIFSCATGSLFTFICEIFSGTASITSGDCDSPPVISNTNATGYTCLGGSPADYNAGWGGTVTLTPESGC